MPIREFKVKSQLFQTIQLKWNLPFRNISVIADDVVIGKGITHQELRSGKVLLLQDGTQVHVKRHSIWVPLAIAIRINGHPIEQKSRPALAQLFNFFF